MKRSPLRRRTPLRPRASLRRTSWLRSATTWLKRHVWLRRKGGHRFTGGEDPAYLAHVRTLPCLLRGVTPCWGSVDPHHTVKRSHASADRSAVPLCRGHHDEVEVTPKSVYRLRYPNLDLAAAAHRIWTVYQEQAA